MLDLFVDILFNATARNGLDTACAACNAGLSRKLEEADLRRVLHMRAAAKLARERTEVNDIHPLAILIAKEHERAHLLCFVERNIAMMQKRKRFANFFIDKL